MQFCPFSLSSLSVPSPIIIGSFGYLLHKELKRGSEIIERAELLEIIIALRKSIFSTLREIAYAANCLKIEESGIEARKIKDIMMRDGCNYLFTQHLRKLNYKISKSLFFSDIRSTVRITLFRINFLALLQALF